MSDTQVVDRYGDCRISLAWNDVDCIKLLLSQFQVRREYDRHYTFVPSQGEAIVRFLRDWYPIVHDMRQNPTLMEDWSENEEFSIDAYLPFLAELEKIDVGLQQIEQYYGNYEALKEVPHCWPMLRTVGFYKEPERETHGGTEPESWHIPDAARSFLVRLGQYLKDALTSEVQEDRTVIQFLEEEGVKAAWDKARTNLSRVTPKFESQQFYPKNDTAGAWIVVAMAKIGGFSFTTRFERRLPKWIVQIPANAYQMAVNGKNQHIVSWSCMSTYQSGEAKSVLLHLSAVGGIVALRALHAYLMDGRMNTLELRSGNGYSRYNEYARREKGRQRYHTTLNDEELPRSGWAHMDITHISATNPPADESIMHLVGNMENAQPDLDLFFRQLDAAISVPLKEEWKDKLWEYGLQERRGHGSQMLIDKLQCFNCTAWIIWPDETRWTRIVVALTKGLEPKAVTSLDVETTADAVQKDEDLIAVIGEEDDDSEDDE